MRCDRIDFPPRGVAYRHTHPGPGIRRLLFGALDDRSRAATTRPTAQAAPGSRARPDPVLATAAETRDTAFVRVMLLPAEWEGKRTIRYLDPADDDKPKLQRATIFLESADRPW